MAKTDVIELKRDLATQSIRLFPPSIRKELLQDTEFVERYGIQVDATIRLRDSGLAFRRSEFFDAVRSTLSGAEGAVVVDADGESWRVDVELIDKRPEITFTRKNTKRIFPGLLLLSPDRNVRLAEFDKDVASIPLGAADQQLKRLRVIIEAGRASEDDIDRIRSEIRLFPISVAEELSQELKDGECSIDLLAPSEVRYFERLIGKWDREGNLSDFVESAVEHHIRSLIAWSPSEGLSLAFMLCSHRSIAEAIAQSEPPLENIVGVLQELVDGGDPISKIGGIEVGLILLDRYPEIEGAVTSLVQKTLRHDPAETARLELLSELIVFVAGETARNRALTDCPPYIRRMASITQASLIVRAISTAGIPLEEVSLDSLRNGQGQYYFLQGMIDLRQEPRWLPDFISPFQLRAECLGRIAGAARLHVESIRSPELRRLLLEDGEGSVRSLLQFPFPYLPGPLEGAEGSCNELPVEMREAVQDQLAAEPLEANSFAALVNSALIFKIGPDHAALAASALRRAKYQIRGGSTSDLQFSLLSGLATVAAVTRSQELANDIRILTRVVRRRLSIGAEDAIRIGLIASAAFEEKLEWASTVGEWMSEIAFEEMSGEVANRLLSHLEVLCEIESSLVPSCGRAQAALSAVVHSRF